MHYHFQNPGMFFSHLEFPEASMSAMACLPAPPCTLWEVVSLGAGQPISFLSLSGPVSSWEAYVVPTLGHVALALTSWPDLLLGSHIRV